MTEVTEHHLEVTRTARYYQVGHCDQEGELWYVLHGYRQTASRFLSRFRTLANDSRMVVAPEALSRFYLGSEPGRHGPESMVGATWMTREDREFEIQDYVRYLDALAEGVGLVSSTTVLGFSQGVATAARWIVLGRIRPDRLILWGDYLPPDLDMELAGSALKHTELVIVRGSEDPALDEESTMKEEERLKRAGITYQVLIYSGGHEIDPQALSQLSTQS